MYKQSNRDGTRLVGLNGTGDVERVERPSQEGPAMSRAGRQRNERLAAIITACDWTYDACAHAIRAVAKESRDNLESLNRSHIAKWISGVRPSGSTDKYLAEAATRRLGWQVTLNDLGLGSDADPRPALADLDWDRDPVADLVTVGRADLERRDFAKTALYSLAALAVPLDTWQEVAERGRRARNTGAKVGTGEVDAVRHMIATFSQADERFGGGHARFAIVAYLTTDVAGYLKGAFTSDDDRRTMFGVAAELTYLVGWKAFDSSQQGVAQRYYLRALRLANEADDGALGGFILRAMAHQAVDLGHGQACLNLADSALEWSRKNGTPGASALFTVVKARGYAAARQKELTVSTLATAERLLAKVDWSAEPVWIHRMGFGEPSLANQTAQALRDLGELEESERQFRRSTATRDGAAHRRIHALTLANLADIQCTRGELADACKNWSKSLDAMAGLQSARASQAVLNLRRRLVALGPRQPAFARALDQRAAGILSTAGRAAHA